MPEGSVSSGVSVLPSPADQAERLIELGVHESSGLAPSQLRRAAAAAAGSGLLVVRPEHAPASSLTPLLQRNGKAGFVVEDMPDVDDFVPLEHVAPPRTGPSTCFAGWTEVTAWRTGVLMRLCPRSRRRAGHRCC